MAMLARPQNPRSTTRRSAFVQGRLIKERPALGCGKRGRCDGQLHRAGPSRIGLGLFAVALAIFLYGPRAGGIAVARFDPSNRRRQRPSRRPPRPVRRHARHDDAFALKDQAETAKVRVGNGIDADVDETTEPWTLSNVHIPATKCDRRDGVPLDQAAADRRPAAGTRFVDQDGRPFRFAQLKDQYVVMAFIYTRCKDARMCPLITSKFAQLQKRLPANVRLVEVTLTRTSTSRPCCGSTPKPSVPISATGPCWAAIPTPCWISQPSSV